MKRTGMPSRAAGMRLCGKQFGSAEAAGLSWRGQQDGARVERCPDKACGKFHVRPGPARPAPVLRGLPATGFSARVKLLVRVRAGNGEITDACCESCGRWLGRYGGQVHHRLGRQAGGCKLTVVNCAANALLLCGTSLTGCHGLATAMGDGMKSAGFVIEHGNDPMLHDPRYVPIKRHALGPSEVLVWLPEDGGPYMFSAPEVAA